MAACSLQGDCIKICLLPFVFYDSQKTLVRLFLKKPVMRGHDRLLVGVSQFVTFVRGRASVTSQVICPVRACRASWAFCGPFRFGLFSKSALSFCGIYPNRCKRQAGKVARKSGNPESLLPWDGPPGVRALIEREHPSAARFPAS
jgi:hypothetical protein